MKKSISVSKKRLDLLLIPLYLFIYFKIYWFVYSFVAESLLSVLLELLSILDILFGAFFLFSAAPCSYLFDKLKGCFSFLPQHLHQHAPQSQHQGAAGSGDDLGEGQKLHAFRAAQYGYVAGTAHIGGAHAGGNRRL